MFDRKSVLITGGTGSFGKNFAQFLLNNFKLKKLTILSRDEFKQFRMAEEIKDPRLDFILGDVRDLPRIRRIFRDFDIVVHAAALKQIPILEHNPLEAIKTNIIGSQNVIEAAIDQGISKVLLISSDKAAEPINLYGATKLCAEKLFVTANTYAPSATRFSVVRYGNVIGSRGSIVETLLAGGKSIKSVRVTDPQMTRFWLSLDQSFELVLFALRNMEGGEIFIPRIPSMKLGDLFDAIVPEAKKEIIGLRPGEKTHEVLLTESESKNALLLGAYFVVLPEVVREKSYKKYFKVGKKLNKKFKYASDTNTAWLTMKNFADKIKARSR
ncbi:MAG TPA: UDP-N-acetylglucosamine 4,6-dehydratase (inverting) [Candidatus Paceibacterota bacterium]|nr:UDP-N-acetylglucosamine 4,6-dehydratase (inverting) [Candidatus Paceibacterota bacterium]